MQLVGRTIGVYDINTVDALKELHGTPYLVVELVESYEDYLRLMAGEPDAPPETLHSQ